MGHHIGKRHAYEMRRRVALYWEPYFQGQSIGDLRRADLKGFTVYLAGRGLSAGSIAKIMEAGTTILRWAHATEMITIDPTEGLGKFSGPVKKRGVLSEDEIRALFCLDWSDERSKIGCMIALTCGLRAGEILGLQIRDIAEQWLFIRHSWNELDKLKAPKNGMERRVPLIPYVHKMVDILVLHNPYGNAPDNYIFFDSSSPYRPMGHHILRGGFEGALSHLVLGENYNAATREERRASLASWRARAISLHSLRHLYAARLSDRITPETIMRTTGYSSRAVFDAYANHLDDAALKEVGSAINDGFGQLFPEE